jgi:hypothetical protein
MGGTTAGGGGGLGDHVRLHVRSAFPQVADVYVTTDPSLVHRIARLGGEVQSGVSVAPRFHEIVAIAQLMAPVTRLGTTGTAPLGPGFATGRPGTTPGSGQAGTRGSTGAGGAR